MASSRRTSCTTPTCCRGWKGACAVTHPHDVAALAALPGRKYVLTNAPRDYALRVLRVLGLLPLFDGVLSIEDMVMFGQLRPKPDARMLRQVAVRLRVAPSRCVLIEDTLVHQKSARRIGMGTAWMLRWIRALPARARDRTRRPAFVDQRLRCLRDLQRRLF